jgi:hypothetical protein
MATVIALESFVGVLEQDVLGEDRIEHHSEFPNQPSVFPGGKGFGAGSLQRNYVKHGKKIDVVKGQRFEDSHPAVKKWPQMFGLVGSDRAVEQATAAPGEKRGR